MARIGVSAVKIADNDGDSATVTNGKLDVNATLVAGATIDIGDVDMFLDGGTAILGGAGAVAAGVLRVTIASDDAHFGEVGADADNDGTIHAQLLYANIKLNDIESDTGTINTNIGYLLAGIDTSGAAFATSDSGYVSLAVRNDTLANLDGNIADGDYSMLQVNDIGALYVTGESLQSEAVTAYGFGIMGEAKDIDGSALPNPVAQGEAGRIAMSRAGIQYTHLTNDTGTHSAILEEDSSHSTGDYGIMTLAVRANSLASLVGTDGDYTPLQVNASGALYIAGTVDLGSTDNGVLDAIASSLEILDDWDDSNYANVNINLAGSDAPTGGGAESGALRVTLANDSTGVITVDGTVDLGSTDNAVLDAMVVDLAAMEALLITIDSDTDAIKTAVELLDNAIDGSEMQVDIVSAPTLTINSPAVTNAGTFVVQEDGAALTALQLIDDAVHVDDAAFTLGSGKGMMMMGFAGVQAVGTNDACALRCSAAGSLHTVQTNITGGGSATAPYQGDGNSYYSGTYGPVVKVIRNDVLAALAAVDDGDYTSMQVDAEGALYTTHGMTGMVSGSNTDVGTSAEILRALGNVACKRVDVIASSANTGVIWVGGSNLTADVGMPLSPGDFYSVDVNGTSDIYVLAAVNGEDVYFNYFT